ncbi:MAG: hypothetical protein CXT73_04840 [Methanobacteriota archaeon]|nr:MAG: hypothetical protein CXT73_04840 [Euryarchaeota archaeon]
MSSSTYKIGIIIPTTSRNRNWKNINDTHFYRLFLKSFFETHDIGHHYTIYLVIDHDDPLYNNENQKKTLLRHFVLLSKRNINLKLIIANNIPKGHVSLMWNLAFKNAYDDGCNYFFQSGDDIVFLQKGWVNRSIEELIKHNNIGLTGPIDYDRWMTGPNSRPGGNRFIQTQSFVSRKHMEIFGFYFPEEVKNWYCDDWMTFTYYPQFYYPIDLFCRNLGGSPRYQIIGTLNEDDPIRKKCFELVSESKNKIIYYLI